ncbi:hypothetical protein MUK42_34151 [Musa troglodytarum]|uniref:Uncharacterized protein n=1 Tax=Musa troglodytarum TaxID=320322 RepID=A0A9E7GK71_9LILI|nr:hypothetical protein MUK42_34151 [Musa troglodytarum]
MSSSPPERRGRGGEEEGGEGAAAAGTRSGVGLGRRRRRPGDPSSSRLRSADAVWPEHFVEAVAAQVAVDAARSDGRLAAAPAVVSVFQLPLCALRQQEEESLLVLLLSFLTIVSMASYASPA